MNFIFECSTRYLTRPLRSLVRCQVEYEKIKFISTSGHVIFCLLYKLMTTFLTIFRRFLTTFRRFPKIFQNWSEGQTNVPEYFREFPKMSEDFRILPKTFDEDPKMFRWYTNEFTYNLRDKLDITEVIDIFTCEDIISSLVRISYRFYQFVTTRYTTDFYIIN